MIKVASCHLITGHGLTLAADDVLELVGRTEGRATGLQLSAAFLAGHGAAGAAGLADIAGDLRAVDDYLTEEVLADRPRRQRRFLLQTSICENLCAGLADAITNGADGRRALEQLERENDFVIRLGAKPLWFRYHHLLRDVLQHRLRLDRRLRGDPGPAGRGPRPAGGPAGGPEVLHYLSTMLTAAEIAASLGLSVNTVKAHMRAVYRKLGATRRTEAVLLARRSGIL